MTKKSGKVQPKKDFILLNKYSENESEIKKKKIKQAVLIFIS